MPLAPGTRLGPYVIDAAIGAGGMGEVYRATDTDLKRAVAIKVLPDTVATDAERLARFQREAEVLARLNHPNIAHVHGLERSGGTIALVMELVEGPTLAERITRGPLPTDEALPIARQIAEALDAAHEQGIVHRDLKPANIKVRDDGTVKVLDFGLAKAMEPAGAMAPSIVDSPTIATPQMTGAGIILGTAAYMAPEQARGRHVDRRADIWAFGCVTYEMLCGARAFTGETTTDVLAAVLTKEPDWSAVPPATPPRIRRLLARCLQKDPRSRLRDIGDARLELESPDIHDEAAPSAAMSAAPTRWWGARWALAGAAGALALVSLTLAWIGFPPSAAAPPPALHLSVTFPENAQMHLALTRPSLSLSPDGSKIVYTAERQPDPAQLWIRDLSGFEPTPLIGTSGARMAAFSPDGRWIAFFADGKLKKIPTATGPPVVLCDAPGASGATWTSADEIVFAQSIGAAAADIGLWRISAAGGERRKVTDGFMWFPDALPGGKAVVVTLDSRSAESAGDLTIAAVDLDSGRVTRLFDGGTYVRFSPTGHLIYLRNNQLYAVAFDPDTLAVSDARVPVASDVYFDPSLPSGNYALSASGTLAYVPGTAEQFQRTLVAAGPDGSRPLVAERRFYGGPRLAPGGRRIAIELRAWNDSVWTIDLERGTSTRITTRGLPSMSEPVWSRDGRQVFVGQAVDGVSNLFAVPSDGSGVEQRLTTSPFAQMPDAVSADGRVLVFTETRPETGDDLFTLSLADGVTRALLATPFNETNAAISPDGRWIAWQSDRSGQFEVYAAAFPGLDSPIQVSGSGGRYPVWSPDGQHLYFNRRTFAATIEMADVVPGTALQLSKARLVGQHSMHDGVFDVMSDGRLVFTTGLGNDGSTTELRVVVNWFGELRRALDQRPD